jgi:hypothetical protein
MNNLGPTTSQKMLKVDPKWKLFSTYDNFRLFFPSKHGDYGAFVPPRINTLCTRSFFDAAVQNLAQ